MSQLDEINDLNFEEKVTRAKATVLLAFSATWCAPCRRLQPMLEKLGEGAQSDVRVGKVDIDEAPLATQEYRVRGAPTLIVFRSGVEVARWLGVPTETKLRELLS